MEEGRQKSWFSRNWGWVLGGGCLVTIIIGVLFIGATVWGVFKAVGESEPYMYAYEKAIQNEVVKEALGTPIEKGFVGSNTEYSYKDNKATVVMTIPINGTLNNGLIYLEGIKENDVWKYTTLYVDVNNVDEDIELLEEVIEEKQDEF